MKRRAEERIQPTKGITHPPRNNDRRENDSTYIHKCFFSDRSLIDTGWWLSISARRFGMRADLACAQIWHAGSQRCRQQVCIRCHPTQFHATIAAQNFLLESTNKRSIFAHLLPVSFSTTPNDAGLHPAREARSLQQSILRFDSTRNNCR
jgi:hypothetical protein